MPASMFLLCLVMLLSGAVRCPALMEIEALTPARASALGIAVHTNMNGEAGTRVRVTFAAAGELQNFSHAELRVGATRFSHVTALLCAERHPAGSVSLSFSADASHLLISRVMLVVTNGVRNQVGYELQVRDFLPARPGR